MEQRRTVKIRQILTEYLCQKLTTAQVVETSVTVNNNSLRKHPFLLALRRWGEERGETDVFAGYNNNSPIQDYVHPDDEPQATFEMTPGFKPFTVCQNASQNFCN